MATISEVKPISKFRRRRLSWEKYLLWLVLGFGSILMVAPFYWTLVTSFKSREEVLVFPPDLVACATHNGALAQLDRFKDRQFYRLLPQ